MKGVNSVRPEKTGRWCLVFFVCGIAVLLRLLGLSERELWIDEGFTYLQLKEGLVPGIPPFHFVLLRPFVSLFGLTAFAMRLPSALADLGFVLAAALLARRCLNERVAWIVTLLAIFSPYLVYYAQEARYYALLNLLLALLFLAAERLLSDTSRPFLCAAAMGCLATLAFCTHYLGLIPIAGLGALVLYHGWRHRNRAAFTAAGLMLGPIAFLVLSQASTQMTTMLAVDMTAVNRTGMPSLDGAVVDTFRKSAYLLYVYLAGFIHLFTFSDDASWVRYADYGKLTLIASALVLVTAGLSDTTRPHRQRGALLVAACLVVLGAFTLFAVEFLGHFYSFQSRHLSFVILPLYLLMAAGIDSLWSRSRLLVLLLLLPLLFFTAGGLAVYHGTPLKAGLEAWSPIVRTMANVPDDHAIIISHIFYPGLAYYCDHLDPGATVCQYPVTWREYAAGRTSRDAAGLGALVDAAARHPVVWVVDARHSLAGDSAIHARLRESHRPAGTTRFLSGRGSSYAQPTFLHLYTSLPPGAD